ncbi:unnamed protein product, partial [marine sediment metagenome]
PAARKVTAAVGTLAVGFPKARPGDQWNHRSTAQAAGRTSGNATFELVIFLQWFFPPLARNSRKLPATNGEDSMSGEHSLGLGKCYEEQRRLVRLERMERESRLLSRERTQVRQVAA